MSRSPGVPSLWTSVLSECETPSLEDVESLILALQSWDSVDILFESGAIVSLFDRLEQEDDLELRSLYLKGVKTIMGKEGGLQRMCRSSNFVGQVALSLDCVDVSICTQVLELLAVLAVGSEDGFESVRSAMDYYRLAKRERVRFESLVEALRSESTSTSFQRDVMLFVNAVVNSAPDVDQRVEIRSDFLRAGALDAIQKLKDRTLICAGSLSTDSYELEIQLQVFETVLENDHKTTLAALEYGDTPDDGGEMAVKLDDVDSLFHAIKTHARQHHCDQQLLGVLQYFVAIPSYDVLGKEQWATILRASHRAVLGVDDDFDCGLEEIKVLLSWKKALEDRDGTIESLRNELKNREKELAKIKNDVPLEKLKEELKIRDAKIAELEKTAAPTKNGTIADDPKYGKYFQMLKMHIPRPAVEAKMRAEGVDPAILNLDPSKPLIVGGKTLQDDPKYAKYFQMLKMHIPRPAVEAKMRAEGVDPAILDQNPLSPSAPKEPVASDHPKFGKYFAMLKMHIPKAAVEAKMRGEGTFVPKLLDLDPSKPIPPNFFGPPLKDDPTFSKYFQMLKMHIPKAAVEGKMRAEGVAEALIPVLSCDPNAPLPDKFKNQSSTTVKKPPPKNDKPSKPNPKPRVAMRSLFWSKIDASLQEKTVWKNLSDEKVQLDLDALELDFAKVKKKSPEEELAEKEKEKLKEAKPTSVGLVDGKVSQNVGIALKKIKMSNKDLVDAIIKVDEGKLDLPRMELLLKSCPSPEDAALVADWAASNDPKLLGQVEAFFFEIAPIPDIQQRLECMVFKQKLETTCEILDDRLKVITAACEQVSRSERLAKLLEVVLKLGNYLNGGTTRGGLIGYKLDALVKLATVKSLDNQKTLMNWLVQWCEEKDPSLLEFATDFPDIDEAARCPLTAWQDDFRQLEKKITLVQQQIAARRKQMAKNDRFVEVLGPFKDQADTEAATLRHRFQATEQRFAVLVASFGEDAKTCGVEAFFKDLLGDFVAAFHKAQSQNQKRRAMEEKAAQKKVAEEKKAALKAQSGELVTNIFQDLGNEAADDILAKLQGPRENRRKKYRGPAPTTDEQANSPNSERMSKFIDRIQGHGSGSRAKKKLDAWRTTTGTTASATPPPPAQSDRAARAQAKLKAFRDKHEDRPQKRASMENQPDLQALAGGDDPAPQGELLRKLQQVKKKNTKRSQV